MSLVSQQQIAQNQLQLKSLTEQHQKQQQIHSKSLTSQRSTQEMINNLREKDKKKSKSSANKHKDPSDPLSIQMPTNANPTDVLATRFSSWRTIIRSLIVYLREIVSVNEEIIRQQIRLHHALTFPFVAQGLDGQFYKPIRSNQATDATNLQNNHSNHNQQSNSQNVDEFQIAEKNFLPLGNGSIQDLATILYQYHSSSALLAQDTVKELNQTIIPRLEDLRRDLLVKIKEIKGLQSDFKNTVSKEQQTTSQELSNYIQSIELAKNNSSVLKPTNDPYLLKVSLDRQIKRQLTEENYLHEAFINLQSSGKELEKVVYIEIQTALTVYAKLIGQQAQNVFDTLIVKLDSSILTKSPQFEWNSFIARDPNFIDPNLPMRHLSEINYNYQNDPMAISIRSDYLERKSKFLKSYSRGWYVLTPTFLHEFKSGDRKKDPIPIMSLSLDEFQITEHQRRDDNHPESPHKFVLSTNKNRMSPMKSHKWVFRADSFDSMISWYNDIKKLTSLPSSQARASIAYERKKQELLSQKSIHRLSNVSSNHQSSNIRKRMSDNINNNSNSVIVDNQSTNINNKNNINEGTSIRSGDNDTIEVDTILTMPTNQSIDNVQSQSQIQSQPPSLHQSPALLQQRQFQQAHLIPTNNHINNSNPITTKYVTVNSNGKEIGIPTDDLNNLNIKDYHQVDNSGTLQLVVPVNEDTTTATNKLSSNTTEASSYVQKEDAINGGGGSITSPSLPTDEDQGYKTVVVADGDDDDDHFPKKETQNDM